MANNTTTLVYAPQDNLDIELAWGWTAATVTVNGTPVMVLTQDNWSWLEADAEPCRTGVRDAIVVLLQELGEVSEQGANDWRTGGMTDELFDEVTSEMLSEGHGVLRFVDHAVDLVPW